MEQIYCKYINIIHILGEIKFKYMGNILKDKYHEILLL